MKGKFFIVSAGILFILVITAAWTRADDCRPLAVTKDHKCPACGMRVAEFTHWHTQMVYEDGTNDAFCAVKCLMAVYLDPGKFKTKKKVKALYAKDYYSLAWHDMKAMFYVEGSDITGPMGKDLVPFSDKGQANGFLKDHNGLKIYGFEEITPELIQKLRNKKGKGM
jgi:copper chaperone NosL